MGKRRHHKQTGFVDWRGRTTGIPDGNSRERYARELLVAQQRDTPHPLDIPTPGRAWFRESADSPWQDLGSVITVRSQDGTVLTSIPDLPVPRLNLIPSPDVLSPTVRDIQEGLQMRMRTMQEALAQMREAMLTVQPLIMPPFQVPRGGISYERGWIAPGYRNRDPRQGEEVYVYDLLPGARVYVLEDVFTVDRVDMQAPLPTVWLKELPTSPLYFSEDESIYLANETEEQS